MPGAVAKVATLINLASVGHLELLREFHGKIVIPPAVWQEVVIKGEGRPGTLEVKKARDIEWVEVQMPQNQDLVKILRQDLDEGEEELDRLREDSGFWIDDRLYQQALKEVEEL
ncbi:MAG: hypothetical protein C4326_02940 [Ignavibacteria bacterium]